MIPSSSHPKSELLPEADAGEPLPNHSVFLLKKGKKREECDIATITKIDSHVLLHTYNILISIATHVHPRCCLLLLSLSSVALLPLSGLLLLRTGPI